MSSPEHATNGTFNAATVSDSTSSTLAAADPGTPITPAAAAGGGAAALLPSVGSTPSTPAAAAGGGAAALRPILKGKRRARTPASIAAEKQAQQKTVELMAGSLAIEYAGGIDAHRALQDKAENGNQAACAELASFAKRGLAAVSAPVWDSGLLFRLFGVVNAAAPTQRWLTAHEKINAFYAFVTENGKHFEYVTGKLQPVVVPDGKHSAFIQKVITIFCTDPKYLSRTSYTFKSKKVNKEDILLSLLQCATAVGVLFTIVSTNTCNEISRDLMKVVFGNPKPWILTIFFTLMSTALGADDKMFLSTRHEDLPTMVGVMVLLCGGNADVICDTAQIVVSKYWLMVTFTNIMDPDREMQFEQKVVLPVLTKAYRAHQRLLNPAPPQKPRTKAKSSGEKRKRGGKVSLEQKRAKFDDAVKKIFGSYVSTFDMTGAQAWNAMEKAIPMEKAVPSMTEEEALSWGEADFSMIDDAAAAAVSAATGVPAAAPHLPIGDNNSAPDLGIPSTSAAAAANGTIID